MYTKEQHLLSQCLWKDTTKSDFTWNSATIYLKKVMSPWYIQPKIGGYPKDEDFIHIDREGGFLTHLPTNQLFPSHGPGPRLNFFPEDVRFSCMPLYIPDQNNLGKTQKIWTSFTVLYTKNISFEMLKVSHIISIFIRMLHNDARSWGLSLMTLKLRIITEFESWWIFIYFPYIYLIIDGKITYLRNYLIFKKLIKTQNSRFPAPRAPSSGQAITHICRWTLLSNHPSFVPRHRLFTKRYSLTI